mmetsp:Transcript_4748/g.12532  ORF Transcript_4748/g.12532 Transcript_4748/m.12532 type:complete len:200 (-) Transcript_4748:85-684(-)
MQRRRPRFGPAHHEAVRSLEALRVVPVLGPSSAAKRDQVVVRLRPCRRSVLVERMRTSTGHPVASRDLVRGVLLAGGKVDQLSHRVRLPEVQYVMVEVVVAQLDKRLAAIWVFSHHLWIEASDPHRCITFRVTCDDVWWEWETFARTNVHLVVHLAVTQAHGLSNDCEAHRAGSLACETHVDCEGQRKPRRARHAGQID